MTVKLGASLDWGTIRKVFSKEVYLTLVSGEDFYRQRVRERPFQVEGRACARGLDVGKSLVCLLEEMQDGQHG